MSGNFRLQSEYKPTGDQPQAIDKLTHGVREGFPHQTLLGVTGSGKTYTMANLIEKVQKPTLVIAHNKTLAAQLAQEYKQFFPDNAVHYFVSYYDYYQPEAYIPTSDTYIEKDAQINEEIDRLRHASTQSLLTRNDVIIVASVSCIYGIGSPEEYKKRHLLLKQGEQFDRRTFLEELVSIFFERTNADLTPGTFRAIGNKVEVMPVSERVIHEVQFVGGTIDRIITIDAVTREVLRDEDHIFLFPAKHFITPEDELKRAMKNIKQELNTQLEAFQKEEKLLEADRLKRRTHYDLAMLKEVGYCNGIENYSRHLSGRKAGEAPDTLLSYFPHKEDGTPDFLTIIDESHVTIPQIAGMYAGDRSRKKTLVEHGFRLPSALDNRPLTYDEFHRRVGQMIFTSATPANYEREVSSQIVEQIIRPTGLLDPRIDVKPIVASNEVKAKSSRSKRDDRPTPPQAEYRGQVHDFIEEAKEAIEKGGRVMATTLTKRMAEDLSQFLSDQGMRAEYLHSEVKTIDRIQTITSFRKGEFDCLVGVNLLREGLDIPEVTLIGILDADKEGFLRSETSLIQTIGRAARNSVGRVILYADNMTGSMQRAIDETERRRTIQKEYNEKHNITPQTIQKNIGDITDQIESLHDKTVQTKLNIDEEQFKKAPKKLIQQKEKQMNAAVKVLDFETAAILRDEIKTLQEKLEEKAKSRKAGSPDQS